MEAADADVYFGRVMRRAPSGTRLARSQALRTYFRFLELCYQTELHAMTGRVVSCPVDEMNRPLISTESALWHGAVSHTWILNMRGLAATIERLRIDRRLEEAIATGGAPLYIAAVFGVSEDTAIRFATNARILLQIPPRPPH